MQQHHSNTMRGYAEAGSSNFTATTGSGDKATIDPMILARLDTGLLNCLHKLGTSRQRICSALCLSYSEYDEIVELLQTTR